MLGEYYVILLAITIILVIKFLIMPEKPPILNVYKTPSNLYLLKVGVLYVAITVKKLIELLITPNNVMEKLDKPQKLHPDENAIDGVYFTGSDIQGDRFSISINLRIDNETESYIFLKTASSEGTLVHIDNPNTISHKKESTNKFSINGLNIVSVIPTRKWKITFNGKLKNTKNSLQHNVHINLDFISNFQIFNYETDSDCLLYSKSLALESWSVEFYRILKEFQSTCYGQFGKLKGTVDVDGKKHELNLNAYRDRVTARNFNWATYHRSIIHYITVENGDRFVIRKLSQPIVTSNFSEGFVYCASDRKCHPLQNCTLELYQQGEIGEAPNSYAFSFEAGGKHYTTQIKIQSSEASYLGNDWDCRLLEKYCTADVNGRKGWGSCQWLYKNIYGKSSTSKCY